MNHFYVCKFPLVKGKIKWRKAKKYLNRWHMRYMLSPVFQKQFSSLAVGDWINDCTGLNGKLTELIPRYTTIYGANGVCFGNASILTDVDMCSEGGRWCSLSNCVSDLKLPRETVEERIIGYCKGYVLGGGGAEWYGVDTEEYAKQCERANKIITTVESGGHVVDEDGAKYLPGYERI
jgi:hypothetical protein